MKIINCRTLGELCEHMLDGEPVYIIRAQDKFAVEAISVYLSMSEKNGGKNTMRTRDELKRIIEWQKANPQRVKVPD